MEPEVLVQQQRQLEQQNMEELLQQRMGMESAAIKKDHEERGIGEFNLEVSSEEQGGGRNPPREGELSQGGIALQSHDVDIERTNVGSDDLTESCQKPHSSPECIQQKLRPAATLEERGSGDRWSGRLRARTSTAKTHNSDQINSGQLEFSDDYSEDDDGKGVEVNQFRNAKPAFIWGTKKRRTESNQANQNRHSRDRGRAKISQDGMTEWLKKLRSQGLWAPAQRQYEISSSKEKHPGRSLDEGVRNVTYHGSSLSSGKLNRPVRRRKMVTHFDSRFPTELGGRHEGSAATTRKPPIRKRKAGILTDELPEDNGLNALSNRRPRSDGTEKAALESIDAFLTGEFAGGYSQWDDLDAIVEGQFARPGTVVHGSHQFYSGRVNSLPLPQLPLEDLGAYIGSHSHSSSQLGGGVQDRDVFSLASEPSTTDSLGTAQSEARQSSDEDYHPSAGHSPYDCETDDVGVPISTSSYPSRSRRSLSYRTDGVPQRVGSISAQLPDDRGPPAHPDNVTQALLAMSAVFHANPISDNEHASLGTSAVPSMNGASMAAGLEGDEDYEPDDGNPLDEEEEEEEEEEEQGLLDLNETPEQEKQLPKTSRAKKKHRPKVFREGRPDGRRKPKNAEGGISKKKVSEGKKVVGNPRGRKKRATSDLKSAQGDYLGKQGDPFMPMAANCGPATDGCAECQNNEGTSDAGRCMHSQGRRAMGTEDLLQSSGDSGFPQNEGPQASRREYILVNSSLVEVRADPSSPNARDYSALATSASASPSPSRKRTGEDEGLVADSPQRLVRRELFKEARTPRSMKRITAYSKDRSGGGETWRTFQKKAIAHPSEVTAAKTMETRPPMRTDASHSQELVPLEPPEPSMGIALRDPAAEVVGAVTSIKCNSSNSEEGVTHESSIIALVLGKPNRSTTTPEEIVLQANRGRSRAAVGVNARQPNDPNRVKRVYIRRTLKPGPKQTDNARIMDLLVNRLANMNLKEYDSGLQLVPYANQNTAMVPFMPLRRKKPRARVMLDGEDKRVWRLLMTQGTSFEDASSEKEAPRQWDEERATMKARAEKFINRMHLVQGDRRFSVWKGSVVDSIVGAFLTQNVSDHLSSSAFMYLAARFPVARKKKAAAEFSQEATVTEVQVEEADEISLKASGISTFIDGAVAVQEGRLTAFHVKEAFDLSEKSSATGEGSSSCCNQQGHDTLSIKLTVIDCERDREPTTQILETGVVNTIREHTKWHYYAEERLPDTREQNSSCSSKNSQSLCTSSEHIATSRARDSLEVRGSEENKTCGVVEDDISLQFESGDVLLASSGHGQRICLSKTSQSLCNSSDHNATLHAGDSLEVRESEMNKTCGVVEGDISLHSGSGDVLLASSGHGELNCTSKTSHSLCNSGEHNGTSHGGVSVEVRESEENKTCGVVEDDISLRSGSGDVLLASSGHGELNCSGKTSQSLCNSSEHHATSHAGDSLEVRGSEENKTCGLVDDISLHYGSGDVLLASSGHGQLNSINSPPLVDVGKREVTEMVMPAPISWIQTDSEVSLIVDLSPTPDDLMTDVDSSLEAIRNGLHVSANSLRTHEIGANSIHPKKNCCPALPGLDVTCAAAEEIVASSGSVESSLGSLDANKLSQSFATLGSDRNSVIGEESGARTAGAIISVDSFDRNKSSDQQLVMSSAAEPSEHLHGQLDVSPHLRILKSLMRKKVQTMRKSKTGPKSLNGTSNSELVSSAGDIQKEKVRGRNRRPVLSLTGIARARLEQSNITSKVAFDWEAVRLKYTGPEMGENRHESAHAGCKSFGSSDVENGVDWDAVRLAKLEDIAEVIKERGMNNVLAGRIKAFLERVQKEHGSVDLEWLRTVSVEEAKSFLLSIRGLGLKSVECIRLLTLHHLAFPVDTNVGRICVRLGWVPLEPLPEELQLHLLEMYPVQETIQKYLWPRLCTLDQRTLYELHYQMITFGKVFCTKSRPNCNACPMRDDCQHFASALASSRLALPEAAHEVSRPTNSEPLALPAAAVEFVKKFNLALAPSEKDDFATGEESVALAPLSQKPCEPIIEEPRTPEPEIADIEDYETFGGVSSQPSGSEKGSSSEIELAVLPAEVSIPDSASKALVVLPPDSASIPVPKLKNVGRLRTVHYVYELPDSHPLVQEMDPREDDDPCFYLLAIWSPGESPHAPPVLDDMYTNGTCDGFNSIEEETVRGTVLVPCRTAMRGVFPLNGTYFQVNEVFADHASSLQPIEVPRTLLWNLRRRFVYFGTSVTSIFKGLSTEEIQACFWRGYVCVRGFDSGSRCPRPLAARLHFPASKMIRKQEKSSFSNAED